MKIKSAVVMSQGADIAIMDLELDDPKANEVLIKTVAATRRSPVAVVRRGSGAGQALAQT